MESDDIVGIVAIVSIAACVIVLGTLFGGEPDLVDGIIEYLKCK